MREQAGASPQQHCKLQNKQEPHHSNIANQKTSRSLTTAILEIIMFVFVTNVLSMLSHCIRNKYYVQHILLVTKMLIQAATTSSQINVTHLFSSPSMSPKSMLASSHSPWLSSNLLCISHLNLRPEICHAQLRGRYIAWFFLIFFLLSKHRQATLSFLCWDERRSPKIVFSKNRFPIRV